VGNLAGAEATKSSVSHSIGAGASASDATWAVARARTCYRGKGGQRWELSSPMLRAPARECRGSDWPVDNPADLLYPFY